MTYSLYVCRSNLDIFFDQLVFCCLFLWTGIEIRANFGALLRSWNKKSYSKFLGHGFFSWAFSALMLFFAIKSSLEYAACCHQRKSHHLFSEKNTTHRFFCLYNVFFLAGTQQTFHTYFFWNLDGFSVFKFCFCLVTKLHWWKVPYHNNSIERRRFWTYPDPFSTRPRLYWLQHGILKNFLKIFCLYFSSFSWLITSGSRHDWLAPMELYTNLF